MRFLSCFQLANGSSVVHNNQAKGTTQINTYCVKMPHRSKVMPIHYLLQLQLIVEVILQHHARLIHHQRTMHRGLLYKQEYIYNMMDGDVLSQLHSRSIGTSKILTQLQAPVVHLLVASFRAPYRKSGSTLLQNEGNGKSDGGSRPHNSLHYKENN